MIRVLLDGAGAKFGDKKLSCGLVDSLYEPAGVQSLAQAVRRVVKRDDDERQKPKIS